MKRAGELFSHKSMNYEVIDVVNIASSVKLVICSLWQSSNKFDFAHLA
jgi:hypothetical protein